MKGIDGSLRNARTFLDAAATSAGSRKNGGGVDGTRAESNPAGAFEDHLLDLHRQEAAAGAPSIRSLAPSCALMSPTNQSFPCKKGTVAGAGKGESEPETKAFDVKSRLPAKVRRSNGGSVGKVLPESPGSVAAVARDAIGTRDTLTGRDNSPETKVFASIGKSIFARFASADEVPIDGRVRMQPLGDSEPWAGSLLLGSEVLLTPSLALGSSPLDVSSIASDAALIGSDERSGPLDGLLADVAGASSRTGTDASAPVSSYELSASFDIEEMPPEPARASKKVVGDQLVATDIGASKAEAFSLPVEAALSLSAFTPVVQPAPTPSGLPASIERAPRVRNFELDEVNGEKRAKDQTNPTSDQSWDRNSDLTLSARMRAVVLDHQTHLAVADELSLTRQIADVIAALASSDNLDANEVNESSSVGLGASGGANSRASASSVQILRLKLEPENLGGVTVRMRLLGTRLDLQVEAERPETMRLIKKDKDLLADKLRSAGYAMDALVIKSSESQAELSKFGVDGSPNGKEQQTTGSNGDPSANDRPSTHDGRQRSRAGLADDAQDRTGVLVSGGDLYI